ncbi:rhodanese-like domain-containing protein [Rubrobacter marinus]|uniref:rhodanese-like domain-containing protein n=1 Tax=Rubrobacter marinus TaxID=2653852 RepID=UPI001A9FE7D6|nr:rhodanese-like domain-containing protein [Rubrobacter marinus]
MVYQQSFSEDAFQEIFPEEVERWRQRGARIVDVRERWEYEGGHLPGARNVPLGELPERVEELRGSPVVLVCASGNRSEGAARFLSRSGFGEVANLLGGTAGWAQRGRPLE